MSEWKWWTETKVFAPEIKSKLKVNQYQSDFLNIYFFHFFSDQKSRWKQICKKINRVLLTLRLEFWSQSSLIWNLERSNFVSNIWSKLDVQNSVIIVRRILKKIGGQLILFLQFCTNCWIVCRWRCMVFLTAMLVGAVLQSTLLDLWL